MKCVRFKDYLKEYRIAPLGSEFSKAAVENLLADEDNVELFRSHLSRNGKDFLIFEYSFDANNKLFALVNREDETDIAGYVRITLPDQSKSIWQVKDAAIYSAYRGLGLGSDLYVKIINSGRSLINDFSLSKEAENLWKNRLPKAVKVAVFNKREHKFYPLSDKPTEDKTSSNDEHEWFFIASPNSGVLEGLRENYSESDGMTNLLYENWLLKRGRQIETYRAAGYFGDSDY